MEKSWGQLCDWQFREGKGGHFWVPAKDDLRKPPC